MKRFFSLIVTFSLLLSLAGCVVYDVKEDHTETKEQLQEIPKQPPKNTVPKKQSLRKPSLRKRNIPSLRN